jgi:hypothetical protein
MISDVLAEACAEIERYLTEMPDTYADILDEVRAVYDAMATLQRKLDNPLGHWDYQAPTPCVYCGLPAMEHDVLGAGLRCPSAAGGNGTTFTLKHATP